jgi:uncharacterized membrane protein SirB2
MFILFKHLHITCALLSIAGFALRGYWMYTGNSRLQHRLARVLPHCVDTVLLATAIAMLVQWNLWPWQQGWLLAKVVALLVYIGLGMIALRFGATRRARAVACLLALATAAYIVSVALTHDARGVLGVL